MNKETVLELVNKILESANTGDITSITIIPRNKDDFSLKVFNSSASLTGCIKPIFVREKLTSRRENGALIIDSE